MLHDRLVGGFVGGCGKGIVRRLPATSHGRVVMHQRRTDGTGWRTTVVDLRQTSALLDSVCTGIEVKLVNLLQRLMVVEVLRGRGRIPTIAATIDLAVVITTAIAIAPGDVRR